VIVAGRFGLRDWSSEFDDSYSGLIDVAVLADLVPVAPPGPGDSRSDLIIVGAEITQAIQHFRSADHLDSPNVFPDNSIRLIAGKPTVVRLYVDYDSQSGLAPISTLSGALILFNPAGSTTLAPIESIQPRRDSSIDRGNRRHTLNFLIPDARSIGELNLFATVFDASDSTQKSGPLERTIQFTQQPPLRIIAVGINYTGDDVTDGATPADLQAPTETDFVDTFELTDRTYPIPGVVITDYRTIDYDDEVESDSQARTHGSEGTWKALSSVMSAKIAAPAPTPASTGPLRTSSSRATYGAPQIHAELVHGHGVVVGHNTVSLLMRRAGLAGLPVVRRGYRVKRVSTTSDLVRRNFHRDGPNQLWVTDITGHPTREGKLYCCVVIDVYSRKVVGWVIDSSQRVDLATNALGMAIDTRGTVAGGIIHGDHGTQFTSWTFTECARRAGLLPSLGNVDDPYDNAVAESFWARLQTELLNRRRWNTRVELANVIFEYVEGFHNRRRRHSALGRQTPIETRTTHPCGTRLITSLSKQPGDDHSIGSRFGRRRARRRPHPRRFAECWAWPIQSISSLLRQAYSRNITSSPRRAYCASRFTICTFRVAATGQAR
jgi:transposase InsO family protein